MRRVWAITKRTLIDFYNDQLTHHAAALTYYGLMSLFPVVLLSLSLLGLVGEYPRTYDAIMGYLRDVVPPSVIVPLDSSLRSALQSKSTAATTLVISVLVALYGTTGTFEATRRAMNVIWERDSGRSFLRRKTIDVVSTFVLMTLVLAGLIMVFVGGRFARDLLGFIGFGSSAGDIWEVVRWPAALVVVMFVFSYIYYVTPDVTQRSHRSVLPGAVAGVAVWLAACFGFASYVSSVTDIGAIYGAFAGAIVLVAWLWLTNVALLFGAELNAAIERERQHDEGLAKTETLNLPTRRG